MFDWDNLRFLIAVAEEGSLSGAARKLRVNHVTVGRRITALEKTLKTRLVDRQAYQCVLTQEGQFILDKANEMQNIAHSIEAILENSHEQLRGTVTVSAPPVLVKNLLARSSIKLHQRYPDIRLILTGKVEPVSINRRQADIAIRLFRPEEQDLVVKKLGAMEFGLYASACYAELHSMENMEFIASTASCAEMPHERWLRAIAGGHPVVFESDDLSSQLEAVQSGVGTAALPCFLASSHEDLVRILPHESITREIWLVTHRKAGQIPIFRAVIDFLVELMGSQTWITPSSMPRVLSDNEKIER
ncbi:LysR family transcriptional regulator [Acidithiobacillus thiooxidans]|uniref:LysR family transcriptional regulator n=1 Tax=Acidithiobacillus thiooxidans TaxID=930 RepID=UPI002857CA27|nr:LysR family transcriptional regulator [Acidithiobacillus thiooxidans]MDR7928696.1 LysR family transcriptional regulator [Acidithiobacillus thiooxidans]